MRTAPQGAVQVGCDGDGVGIVTDWQQLVHHSAGDQLDGGLGCIQGRVRSLKHDMAKGVEQERATFPLLRRSHSSDVTCWPGRPAYRFMPDYRLGRWKLPQSSSTQDPRTSSSDPTRVGTGKVEVAARGLRPPLEG